MKPITAIDYNNNLNKAYADLGVNFSIEESEKIREIKDNPNRPAKNVQHRYPVKGGLS